MEIDFREMDHGIGLIQLTGRLDIGGTSQIETKFAGYCSGDKALVIVDLSGVDFLASIGIRLLVITAKAVSMRAGKMVLLAPVDEVHHVLEVTGIHSIIPIYAKLESAQAVLLANG